MFGWLKGKKPAGIGPDFSGITSLQKATAAFQRGELEKLYLVPTQFGGNESRENMLYVPLGVASIKAGIDENIVAPLIAEGKVTEYKAIPEYQGKSFVPIAIQIVASNPGKFSTTINIWGSALQRANSA